MARKSKPKPEEAAETAEGGEATPAMVRFALLYRGNGREAAQLAGATGSVATLAVTASRWMQHPTVATIIEQRRELAHLDEPEADDGDLPTDPNERMLTRLRDDPTARDGARIDAAKALAKLKKDQRSGGDLEAYQAEFRAKLNEENRKMHARRRTRGRDAA